MDIKEVIDIIEQLNEELFGENYSEIWISSFLELNAINSYTFNIKFLGDVIWYSSEDNRKFDEDKNEYEPLKDFLKREMKNSINRINQIGDKL